MSLAGGSTLGDIGHTCWRLGDRVIAVTMSYQVRGPEGKNDVRVEDQGLKPGGLSKDIQFLTGADLR